DRPNLARSPRYVDPEGVIRGRLLASRVEVLRARGEGAEADRVAKEALALLTPGHQRRTWLVLLASDPALHEAEVAAVAARLKALVENKEAPWLTRAERATALGVARLRLGEWKGAVESLEQAQRIRPGGVRGTLFYLALAHARAGNPAQARE